MNTDRPAVRLAAALGASIALAGCSLLSAPWHKEPPPPAVVEPPAPPPLPEPVATHRFELATPDDDVVGVLQLTTATKDDTLPDIARRFNVGYEEIVRANPGVDPWLPGADRRIVVPSQFVLPNAVREGVVINLAAMRIFYYPKPKKGEAQVVYTHPIGVGKVGWSTPEGTTRIIARETDPIWRPSAAVRREHEENGDPVAKVVMPGPDNPLGKYKFTLAWPSYLIHGTNKPYGVGLRSSHGCIRLYPEDIEKLYQMVPLGTKVTVVNQPFVFGWHQGQLQLQAYTVLEDDPRNWKKAQQTLLAKSLSPRLQKLIKAHGASVDWAAVAVVAHQPRGVVVPVSGPAGSIEAVIAAAPLVQNRIPPGANWAGEDQAPPDQPGFEQIMSEREPSTASAAPAPPAPRPPAGAPRG
ncbi:MAG: L,D-transpeptidase family protein [Gammaproteobacteria bacterium]|nr:L,D-transpeptidase family protein [Gammaproteobacteria bacterium]